MRKSVLMVAALLASVFAAPAAFSQSDAKSIPETAMAAGQFKTLVAAVKAAELLDTLAGDGPFTVLAPTDDAFAALPDGTVESLLKPENKAKLVSILKLHVAAGKLTSDMAEPGGQFPNLAESPLTVKVDGDKITVGGATVVKADIDCSNGVIHVIDKVLLPSSGDAVDPKSLVGKWVYTKSVSDGKPRTAKDLENQTAQVTETSWTLEGEAKFVMDYKIDSSTTPNKIRLTITESPFGAGMSTGGLIKFDGKELVLCYSARGGDAPTAFESKPGTGVNLFYLKKAE